MRYFGRKSSKLISKYIESYSEQGEILLDPFAGSGSSIEVALKLSRRAIYNDLNPVAVIMAKANLLRKETKIELSKKYRYLYMINGKEVVYYVWEGDKIIRAKLSNGEIIGYQGSDYEGDIPYWYPKDPMYYNNNRPFIKKGKINSVDEFFTRRNLLILSEILNEIPKDEKALATFIATLYKASKMERERYGYFGVPAYWIPKRRVEKNPYLIFEKTLEMINKKGYEKTEGDISKVLNGEADITFLNVDAKRLPVQDNSVDLVVTDPPFYDEIQYFELFYLATSWLRLKLDFDNEIIVNHNRGKDEKRYLSDLEKAVKEIHRVLKKDKYAIIMFHEESEEKVKEIKDILSSFFTITKQDTTEMRQRSIGHRGGRILEIFVMKKG